jgi:hypothetical protein
MSKMYRLVDKDNLNVDERWRNGLWRETNYPHFAVVREPSLKFTTPRPISDYLSISCRAGS